MAAARQMPGMAGLQQAMSPYGMPLGTAGAAGSLQYQSAQGYSAIYDNYNKALQQQQAARAQAQLQAQELTRQRLAHGTAAGVTSAAGTTAVAALQSAPTQVPQAAQVLAGGMPGVRTSSPAVSSQLTSSQQQLKPHEKIAASAAAAAAATLVGTSQPQAIALPTNSQIPTSASQAAAAAVAALQLKPAGSQLQTSGAVPGGTKASSVTGMASALAAVHPGMQAMQRAMLGMQYPGAGMAMQAPGGYMMAPGGYMMPQMMMAGGTQQIAMTPDQVPVAAANATNTNTWPITRTTAPNTAVAKAIQAVQWLQNANKRASESNTWNLPPPPANLSHEIKTLTRKFALSQKIPVHLLNSAQIVPKGWGGVAAAKMDPYQQMLAAQRGMMGAAAMPGMPQMAHMGMIDASGNWIMPGMPGAPRMGKKMAPSVGPSASTAYAMDKAKALAISEVATKKVAEAAKKAAESAGEASEAPKNPDSESPKEDGPKDGEAGKDVDGAKAGGKEKAEAKIEEEKKGLKAFWTNTWSKEKEIKIRKARGILKAAAEPATGTEDAPSQGHGEVKAADDDAPIADAPAVAEPTKADEAKPPEAEAEPEPGKDAKKDADKEREKEKDKDDSLSADVESNYSATQIMDVH